MSSLRDVRVESVSPLRLRLLLEVQRRGSIAAAADACAVGQPSASVHLRTLEAATGRMLLHRNGRGSGLTEAGSVVAGHAARILAVLDEMQNELETLQAGERGTLSIAASGTASVAVLPGALQRFAERHPGIAVTVANAPSGTVLRRVAHDEVDLGIAGETRAGYSVDRETILDDEVVGIAAHGRLRLNGGRAELDELDRNTVLVGPQDSSTRAVTERYLARAGFRPSRVWEFDSAEAITQFVRAGIGIGFLSRLLVEDASARDGVVAFRVAGVEPMMRPLQLIRPRDRALTPAAAAFAAVVARTASLESRKV
jgi:molybdate transport repressor ModE-like protein